MTILPLLAILVSGAAPDAPERAFSHREHLKLPGSSKCSSCHTKGAAADVERPAKSDHSSCNSADCHAKEFFTAEQQNTNLCLVCHLSKEWPALEKKRENIRPFPRGRARPQQDDEADRSYLDEWDYYAEFSHKQHLRKGGPIEAKTEDSCNYCHKISVEEGKASVERPGHQHCVNCHGAAKSGKGAPKNSMSDCASCHKFRRNQAGTLVKTGPAPKRDNSRVTAKFSHEKHRVQRRKSAPKEITNCGMCHLQVNKAATLAEIAATSGQRTMEAACGKCHDGKQKSISGRSIFSITAQCTLCHTQRFVDELDED
jgi:hypothetical protein